MTMTTTPGYIGKCRRCKAPVFATADEAREAGYQVLSPCCKRWTVVLAVKGTVSSRECGEHCTEATGLSCKCECGGASHGLAHRVR